MSAKSFTYAGPMPPSVNHTWGRKGKKTFLRREAREWREKVKKVFLESECAKGGPMTKDVECKVKLCPRDRRRRDVDNYLKIALDGLQHAGTLLDDRQVTHLCARMCRCQSCFTSFVCSVKGA